MPDNEHVISRAIKEIAGKVAKRIATGQVANLQRIPVPAYVHHIYSHLGACKNDQTYANLLT